MRAMLESLRQFTLLSAVLRLLLAMVSGGIVGYGRSQKARAAGFRTYMLISIGAAMAVLLTQYLYQMLLGEWSGAVEEVGMKFDASRLASSVITGIGFLGAGTIIITKRMTIKGLTTAAGLWTTGVIGLAIGCGYYELGLIGTGFVLLTESVLSRIGSRIQHTPGYSVELQYNEKTSLDQVLRFCKDNHLFIVNLKIQTTDGAAESRYVASVSLRGVMRQDALVARIQQMPGIVSAMGL